MTKLRDALCNPKTALQLLSLILHQRQHTAFKTDLEHVKLLGNFRDKCQDVFVQLVEFLSSTHSSHSNGDIAGVSSCIFIIAHGRCCSGFEFNQDHCLDPQTLAYMDMIPGFDALCGNLHIEAHMALALARPLISAAVECRHMGDGQTSLSLRSNDMHEQRVKLILQQWDPSLGLVQGRVQAALPSKIWRHITLDLYLIFNSLALHDIVLPTDLYERHLASLRTRCGANQRSAHDLGSDKKKREASKCANTLEQLELEFKIRQRHTRIILGEIDARKESLMLQSTAIPCSAIAQEILCSLVIPRITLTLSDALFCSQFFLYLHQIMTPNFCSLRYFDCVLQYVVPMIFAATDHEAAAIGSFVKATLEPLRQWRLERTSYELQAEVCPGFFVDGSSIGYESYCSIFSKWYDTLTRTILRCLGDYILHGRACLIFLIKVGRLNSILAVIKLPRSSSKCIHLKRARITSFF